MFVWKIMFQFWHEMHNRFLCGKVQHSIGPMTMFANKRTLINKVDCSNASSVNKDSTYNIRLLITKVGVCYCSRMSYLLFQYLCGFYSYGFL